ncbi:bifunctional 4-hydroxy-2-oxoglutarate aldolase/2-dehydro-3-deoxy-phosphogluconate aldolase [Alicyclobacillaceae bacterium I2511]|nr:bifunctional 4-hydroxy-2-oxoglutarate aldolase/2-dehydro-3-deoxy-phosphogluconate aldolase [Alicyclobacillaceae bacterium I2511]
MGSVIDKLCQEGIVAVVRASSEEETLSIVQGCMEAGIHAIEITFTVPNAHDILRRLTDMFGRKVIVGAGTVLDSETARVAILSGAQFIVAPCLDVGTANLCNRYAVPYLPGAMTVKEIKECLECGTQVVKIFPGELLGPRFIKSIRGPFPYAQFMPTGGVSVANVTEWISAGAVAVGVGSMLTQLILKDFHAGVELGRELKKKVAEAREVKQD